MTTLAESAPAFTDPMTSHRSPRWPALVAAWYIGVFCIVTSTAVVWTMATGSSVGDNGTVLLAIGLRMVTIGLALASIGVLGQRLPAWMVLAGLWGAAAVQLVYPLAETIVKALILLHVIAPIDKGISNMSAEGWFNFASAWAIWGVPGVLFTLAALSYRRRVTVRTRFVLLGVVGGIVFLFGLGFLIG